MPLQVVTANRGKDVSIFEKLNPFVEKLVGAYKQKLQNEWDAEWQLEAINILESDGNQDISKNLLANVDPPPGYIDEEGATNWAKETVGNMSMVQQKEVLTGGLTPTSAIPKPTDQTTEQEPDVIPDKMEWNEAFKMISELGPGKTDWSSLTDMFKKRIESGKAMGAAASSFLNMIMGQAPTDQRAELGRNIDMTDKYMGAFYPEKTSTKMPTSEMGLWLENPELHAEWLKAKNAGKNVIDLEAFNKWLTESDMTIKGGTINPTTGNMSYNFGPAPEGKKTFEQAIKDAKKWVKENPGMEIGNINFTTETVSVRQKGGDGTGGGGTKRPNIDKFLFGDTGIINKYIQGLMEDGMGLADEDKELVVKNYNLQKHTLTEEEVSAVELFFEQKGIDPNKDYSKDDGKKNDPKKGWLETIFTPTEGSRDKYGYVLGEEKIGNDGKKYKYMGNDEWKPVY